MSEDRKPPEPPPRPGYIPRPPSQADLDRVSSQQGLIADEWTGEPEKAEPAPPEKRPE